MPDMMATSRGSTAKVIVGYIVGNGRRKSPFQGIAAGFLGEEKNTLWTVKAGTAACHPRHTGSVDRGLGRVPAPMT